MRTVVWVWDPAALFVDGTYWWLITKNMECTNCKSSTVATTEDFLKQMHVFDRAAFKVYLGR